MINLNTHSLSFNNKNILSLITVKCYVLNVHTVRSYLFFNILIKREYNLKLNAFQFYKRTLIDINQTTNIVMVVVVVTMKYLFKRVQ